ncbi:MAG: hypothetical protein DME19_18885 [Verrucomicrobia bacterium]|nr:MAG: hypothetical protein DME19_18885 [Verrucomicrobiota bacterium]
MSTTFQLVNPHASLPDWYPPVDAERPNEYPLRFVELDMLIGAMTAIGVVDGHISESDFIAPGARIEREKCQLISRALRRFATEEIPSDLFSTLERRWNAIQVRFRSEVAARGEVVISGLESFPYDNKALRRVLLHWGAFNAIAADNSGYRVRDSDGTKEF